MELGKGFEVEARKFPKTEIQTDCDSDNYWHPGFIPGG
jgi:hypothetical protein